MSNRYALVDSEGTVVNCIVWNGQDDYTPPDGLTAVPHDTAGPGGNLIDGTYTPPDRQDEDGDVEAG